jgi:nicotinamidase/pyrazinamidase
VAAHVEGYVGNVIVMAVEYDAETALVVVDVQNDFADPAGSLSVPGADKVVEATNAEIARASAAGATVVYTQDWHPQHTPHFVTDGGPWPVHCVAGTWGAELHPRLTVNGPAVRKGTGGEDGYSGFTMRDVTSGEDRSTGLDELLRERGIKRVVVAGLALDYCVKATALDAVALGYETVVPTAATAPVEVTAGDGAKAEAELASAGVELAA